MASKERNRRAWTIIIVATLIAVVTLTFTFGDVYAANDYKYEYKTVWEGGWKTKKANKWSYAGGQRAGGYRFASGKGGFHWSEGGGPTISVSIGASAGFASVSVGVSAGKRTNTGGEFVAVGGKPSYVKKHYYKLVVKPTIKYRRYKVYERVKARYTQSGKPGKWKCIAKLTKTKPYRMDLGTKVVK